MNPKSKYKTKQRELLLDYFRSVPGQHVTAGDVCEYMKEQEANIGQSTVYRHLEKLVDEGIINKYIIDGNSPACFEYVDTEEHAGGEICYHCKCEKCGKLIHMHCEELQEMQTHLYQDHHFAVNPKRTVFYGICEQCLKEERGITQ